jgi:hypothetical protein
MAHRSFIPALIHAPKMMLKWTKVSAGNWADNSRGVESLMSKHRPGGYLGGSSLVRASVGLLLMRTKKTTEKVQREREKLAAAKAEFDESGTSKLIKSDSKEGQKLLLKHIAAQERAKRRAERKALRRS